MNFLLNVCFVFLRVGDHNYVAKSEVNNQPESAVIKVKHVVSPMHPQTFMTLSCLVVRKGNTYLNKPTGVKCCKFDYL